MLAAHHARRFSDGREGEECRGLGRSPRNDTRLVLVHPSTCAASSDFSP